MTIIRGLEAAVSVACTAPVFASPAQADQVMQGVYNYMPRDGQAGTWTIYPSFRLSASCASR